MTVECCNGKGALWKENYKPLKSLTVKAEEQAKSRQPSTRTNVVILSSV